ncbi:MULTISPECIES: MFS transporter [Pseudomonas]|uniref:MFS transporter n=1 Tax=Pseudomonas quercus TaxID=2722792 RepID=A0ABX0YM72_9PSED|nr:MULTISPECIES: MFS transporter [Pseudomonas]MBF7144695.1 MFS transporter [Pseudomonas sp. LY10J]NJP03232.1 MFS transporter [Pseudomonas quercus]
MKNELPRYTYLYFVAQSINLTTAVMSVTMAAIVGSTLAPVAALSTVPYGFQFLFLLLATYPASRLMSRIGRKKTFILGAIPLAGSGFIGFWAVENKNFAMLVLSHSALGIYIAVANFSRFAAADNLNPSLKPKAISLVVAGGIIAAVVGPTLTELFREVGGYSLFSLCYASFIGLAFLSSLVATFLPKKVVVAVFQRESGKAAALQAPLTTREIGIAIAVAGLGYGVMNLLMIQSSLHMRGMGEDFSNIRISIQWHVLAMFLPSFFSGSIIHKFGEKITLCAGLVMLVGCTLINIGSSTYIMMVSSLIILGFGWNLTYIGGGAMLARPLMDLSAATKMQGKSDLAIAICATVGAFTPSLLFDILGWEGTNILCMALCIVLLWGTIKLLKNNHSPG